MAKYLKMQMPGRGKRRFSSLLTALSLVLFASYAHAETTLRIAISLSDIPNLWGVPDGGFEGVRFAGYTLYDSLVEWDLSSANQPSRLAPGLAESWSIDSAKTRWTFKLRDAKFHDGSPWNADAAIWNLDAYLNSKSSQYNATRAGANRTRTLSIASYGKIDDHTIYIDTVKPDAFLLYELSGVFFVSPTRFAEVSADWNKYSQDPSGTGPYSFVSLAPHQSLTLAANKNYWNPGRVPKTDLLQLIPVPDENTRVAALRSGQVDLVDTLPPDSIDSLKHAGFQISENVYPHTWMWRLNFDPSSPFSDIRIRKAVNLAIDRDAIVELLDHTAIPARGFAPPDAPWFGKPSFDIHYDPDAAKKLLADAGYGPTHRLPLKVIISSSGGGQMVPLAMNEVIQQDLTAVGIDVTYQVMDFSSMINMLRVGAKDAHADAINVAMTMQDPPSGIVAYGSALAPPHGGNWGFYNNPAFDAAMAVAQSEFDPAKQDQALAHVNEVLTDDAAAIVVVHDVGPRGLSPKLHGFVQAQNWYQDYTRIEMGP